jgi:hypothetical protein
MAHNTDTNAEQRLWLSVNVPSMLRGCKDAHQLKFYRAHWIVAAQLEFFEFNCKYSHSAYYKIKTFKVPRNR